MKPTFSNDARIVSTVDRGSNEMKPAKPTSERYMTGWFAVKFKGDYRRARREAERYVRGERQRA